MSCIYIIPQCAPSPQWEPAYPPARPWSKGMMEASHAFEPGSSPGGRNHASFFGSLVVVFIFVAREPPSKPHHAMRLSLSSVPLGLPLWGLPFCFEPFVIHPSIQMQPFLTSSSISSPCNFVVSSHKPSFPPGGAGRSGESAAESLPVPPVWKACKIFDEATGKTYYQ